MRATCLAHLIPWCDRWPPVLPGADSASYQMSIVRFFPGAKRQNHESDLRPRSSVEVGRAIVQAFSRPLSTAAVVFDPRSGHAGFMVDKVALLVGFLRVLRIPLPILNPLTAPHSSSSIFRGWYYEPISGRCAKWTQSHPTPRNKKNTVEVKDPFSYTSTSPYVFVDCCLITWLIAGITSVLACQL
jgi:hypothetical protein